MGIDLTGLGSVADFAKSIVDRVFPPSASPEEKLKAETQIAQELGKREDTIVDAKAKIMVAELNQEDNYTKRGRPTIIYSGLAFIGLVHVVFPILVWVTMTMKEQVVVMPQLALPPEFWWAWGGAVSVYILGRSAEKSGGEVQGLLGKAYGMIGGIKK